MGTVLDSHFLALTAIVTVAYQFLFFVITALLKFDKVTDFAGSTNFVILAVLTLVLKGSWHFRQIVLSLLVIIWGLRLGLFLLMRIMQWGEDRRLDKMRANLGKLAVFWIFQAVWVWTVSLPVTVVNSSNKTPSIQAADFIGWIMWSVGFLVEAIADQQKLVFKNSPQNRGKWCDVGLWKYTRHPNYFGEIFLWWGVFVASTPVLDGAEWLVILGPIFLTLLLLFLSGIPLLEESADKKYGNVNEYRLYKRSTSPLVPLPPVLYKNFPSWFKATFLFEFPLYSRNLLQEPLNCNSEQLKSQRLGSENYLPGPKQTQKARTPTLSEMIMKAIESLHNDDEGDLINKGKLILRGQVLYEFFYRLFIGFRNRKCDLVIDL